MTVLDATATVFERYAKIVGELSEKTTTTTIKQQLFTIVMLI